MKIFKNPIFMFILGVIVTGSIGVVASGIFANQVTYDNTTSGLKDSNNQDVTTVQGAIDTLYIKANRGFKKSIENLNLLSTNTLTYNFVPNYIIVECAGIVEKSCGAQMSLSPLKYSYSTNCGRSGSITINGNTVDIVVAGYVQGDDVDQCTVIAIE